MVNFLSSEDQELCISLDFFNSGWQLWLNRDPMGKPVSIFFRLDPDKVDEMDETDFWLELEPGHILELTSIFQNHMEAYYNNIEPKKEEGNG